MMTEEVYIYLDADIYTGNLKDSCNKMHHADTLASNKGNGNSGDLLVKSRFLEAIVSKWVGS